MTKLLKIDTPRDYLDYVGATGRHRLVGVIDFEEVSPIPSSINDYGVYGIFMHSRVRDDLTYGSGGFWGSTGSLICVAPGQVGGRDAPGELVDIDGWALLFHPDLLAGTLLEREMDRFSFFDYSANEALFMDERERDVLVSLMRNISEETARDADSEQDGIIVSYISAMLHYCNRAYQRQFSTLRRSSDDILVRLSGVLNDYYDRGLQLEHGLASVQYCAERLCMSPNYFGDMIRKYTGESAGNFIRHHVVRMAKNMLIASGSVSKVAYDLGFDYPQHFTRMFKNHVGMTPSQYLLSKRP